MRQHEAIKARIGLSRSSVSPRTYLSRWAGGRLDRKSPRVAKGSDSGKPPEQPMKLSDRVCVDEFIQHRLIGASEDT